MPPDATPTTTQTDPTPVPAPDIPPPAPTGRAAEAKVFSRVLTNLHHGGHAVPDETPAGRSHRSADASVLAEVVLSDASGDVNKISTPFGYLFDELKETYPDAHLPVEPASTVVTALKALGSAMVDAPAPADPVSTIPPVYTYWGQFVDHDITANTDREKIIDIAGDPLTPIEPGFVLSLLRNLREPALNLDSVYGNGPDAPDDDDQVPYNGITLRTGFLVNGPGIDVPGGDLPRTAVATPDVPAGRARIGDSRNDENLIVAQLHLAFLEFHNKAVQHVIDNEKWITDDKARFARARQLTTWHYQRITVEDFLRRVALGSVVDDVLASADNPVVRTVEGEPEIFMPLEHSVAAYRFGHSMVRADYDHNENFGRPEPTATDPNPDDPDPLNPSRATFEQLFQFTGNNVIQVPGTGFISVPQLPDNWPIRWKRFTDHTKADRFARKIDTHLAPPLKDLTNDGNKDDDGNQLPPRESRILKRLAVRNLLRGYRLAIPTGQAVAAAIGVAPLTEQELLGEPDDMSNQGVRDALIDGDFVDATPLWFYVLKEAEVAPRNGERLGPVGSHVVCTTIIGQIKADPESYLRKNGGPWTFAEGVKLPGNREVKTIRDFLEFAGVLK